MPFARLVNTRLVMMPSAVGRVVSPDTGAGLTVTSYLVIELPPSEAGADQVTVAWRSPGAAWTPVGAPGALMPMARGMLVSGGVTPEVRGATVRVKLKVPETVAVKTVISFEIKAFRLASTKVSVLLRSPPPVTDHLKRTSPEISFLFVLQARPTKEVLSPTSMVTEFSTAPVAPFRIRRIPGIGSPPGRVLGRLPIGRVLAPAHSLKWTPWISPRFRRTDATMSPKSKRAA